MKIEVDEPTRKLIIGTMDRWIAGNPVWTLAHIIKKWGGEFECSAWPMTSSFEQRMKRELQLIMLRHEWILKFGFAIPCAELIEPCRKYAPILDVGAGTGYMTKLMRNAGVVASGTDPFKNSYGFKGGAYDDKQLGLRASTAIKAADKRTTVFCSWPSYSETWFRRALQAMYVSQRLIVIREDATAEAGAWEYLAACFQQEEWVQIPCWPFMHDRCEVWVKKRNARRV